MVAPKRATLMNCCCKRFSSKISNSQVLVSVVREAYSGGCWQYKARRINSNCQHRATSRVPRQAIQTSGNWPASLSRRQWWHRQLCRMALVVWAPSLVDQRRAQVARNTLWTTATGKE